MPFDGNGNYKFPINSWNPAVNGNQATAQDWQQTIDDLATALSSVVVADGQKMLSGNLRMGNNKVTGLGAPSDDTDAVRRAQLKKGTSITSAATITAPTEGSSFDVNGSVNLEGFSGGYDGQSFVLVFSNVITIKNSERLKTSSGLDIKVVVGHAYNFVRIADDRWFVFDTTRTAESISFKPEGNIAATNVQAAIKELDDEKQPKGDYQAALGYTPVNKAGDTMTGALVSTALRVTGQVVSGQAWGNSSTSTMMDSDSLYLGNAFSRFRFGRESATLNLWRYNWDGTYLGRIWSVGADNVMRYDNRPVAALRNMALAGDRVNHEGDSFIITLTGTGTFIAPAYHAVVGVQTDASANVRYLVTRRLFVREA